MIYEELPILPWDTDKSFAIVHCIAWDARMGKGFALEATRRYPQATSVARKENKFKRVGDILVVRTEDMDRTMVHLITKRKSLGKPVIRDLRIALETLRDEYVLQGNTKIAMPRIASNLDGIPWTTTSLMIHRIFKDIDVHIKVCSGGNYGR